MATISSKVCIGISWNLLVFVKLKEMINQIHMLIIMITYAFGWHTLCSPGHFALWANFQESYFASQNILILNTFCSLEVFNPLLPETLCSSTQFSPWNTLLPETLCFSKHFAPWNTFLQSLIQWSRKQSVSGSKEFLRAKCAEE